MMESLVMKRLLVVVAALAAGWLLMPFLGLYNDVPAQDTTQPRVQFAEDREGKPLTARPVPFDGNRAMEHLRALCDIGPRISGTEGMRKQQALIRNHFEALGLPVREQNFRARQSSQRRDVAMTNLIVSIQPQRQRRVIFCSHYDTRPIADQEHDTRKWRDPFVSANDGGSGVALLMELARHLKDLKTDVGVDLVFFDGEEYIFEKSDQYFFGSKHFAETWLRSKNRPQYLGAILLDMIGGKDAHFPWEGHSLDAAERMCLDLWTIADQLQCRCFERERGHDVLDDHLALLKAGIPAVDIIDFSYKHWHRLSDVPENCSPESLEQVARVLSVWLQYLR
jgi:hypothetical protein